MEVRRWWRWTSCACREGTNGNEVTRWAGRSGLVSNILDRRAEIVRNPSTDPERGGSIHRGPRSERQLSQRGRRTMNPSGVGQVGSQGIQPIWPIATSAGTMRSPDVRGKHRRTGGGDQSRTTFSGLFPREGPDSMARTSSGARREARVQASDGARRSLIHKLITIRDQPWPFGLGVRRNVATEANERGESALLPSLSCGANAKKKIIDRSKEPDGRIVDRTKQWVMVFLLQEFEEETIAISAPIAIPQVALIFLSPEEAGHGWIAFAVAENIMHRTRQLSHPLMGDGNVPILVWS